jgi:mono/diheme cytochrome c family protein
MPWLVQHIRLLSLRPKGLRGLITMSVVVATFGGIIVAGAQDASGQDSAAHEYTIYCAKCHGEDGRGDGTYAPKLHQKPRDFTNCVVMAPIPDATIVRAIEQGGDGVGLSNEMPGWQGALDDDEIAALARYIRGFCKKTPAS